MVRAFVDMNRSWEGTLVGEKEGRDERERSFAFLLYPFSIEVVVRWRTCKNQRVQNKHLIMDPAELQEKLKQVFAFTKLIKRYMSTITISF